MRTKPISLSSYHKLSLPMAKVCQINMNWYRVAGSQDVILVSFAKREEVGLHGNHKEADTRLFLHSHDAINEGYKKLLVISQDTDVLLLLIHLTASKLV